MFLSFLEDVFLCLVSFIFLVINLNSLLMIVKTTYSEVKLVKQNDKNQEHSEYDRIGNRSCLWFSEIQIETCFSYVNLIVSNSQNILFFEIPRSCCIYPFRVLLALISLLFQLIIYPEKVTKLAILLSDFMLICVLRKYELLWTIFCIYCLWYLCFSQKALLLFYLKLKDCLNIFYFLFFSLESQSGPASVIIESQDAPTPDSASFILKTSEFQSSFDNLPTPQEPVVEVIPGRIYKL